MLLLRCGVDDFEKRSDGGGGEWAEVNFLAASRRPFAFVCDLLVSGVWKDAGVEMIIDEGGEKDDSVVGCLRLMLNDEFVGDVRDVSDVCCCCCCPLLLLLFVCVLRLFSCTNRSIVHLSNFDNLFVCFIIRIRILASF